MWLRFIMAIPRHIRRVTTEALRFKVWYQFRPRPASLPRAMYQKDVSKTTRTLQEVIIPGA